MGALALGRGFAIPILAGLGLSSTALMSWRFFSKYYKPAMGVLVGLSVIGGVLAICAVLTTIQAIRKMTLLAAACIRRDRAA